MARTNDTVRDQVLELIDAGRTFTNRQVVLQASSPVTIHAARRVTRQLVRSRRIRVVGHIGLNRRAEVYGPGRFADRV